jgi:hypothetical protein
MESFAKLEGKPKARTRPYFDGNLCGGSLREEGRYSPKSGEIRIRRPSTIDECEDEQAKVGSDRRPGHPRHGDRPHEDREHDSERQKQSRRGHGA